MLGLGALAEQVAVGMNHPARLTSGAGSEDDQRRVLGIHRLDRGGCLLGKVLVENGRHVGHRHRRHPVRQLSEQAFLAHAELRIGSSDPQLEIPLAQLRVAGQRHRSHPPASKQRESPLDPVPHQRHHHVAALDAPSSKSSREPGGLGNQFPEVPVPPIPLSINSNDPQPRSGRRLHHILDEIHARQSALRVGVECPSPGGRRAAGSSLRARAVPHEPPGEGHSTPTCEERAREKAEAETPPRRLWKDV